MTDKLMIIYELLNSDKVQLISEAARESIDY